MLWHAINQALSNGDKHFDLGGLSEDTPYGIRKFKSGLNGKPYSLIGEYLFTTLSFK